MNNIRTQHGASALGLIAAVGLFAGLMVYTTQYAFVKEAQTSADSTTIESVDTQTANTADTSIVAPSASGIFNTEGHISEPLTSEVTGTESSVTADATTNIDSANTAPDIIGETATSPNYSIQTAVIDSTSETAAVPVYAPFQPADDHFDGYSQSQQQADMNMANHYYGNGAGYGQGRGQGRGHSSANGDGQFDFSMSFTSRANMNADTDWTANADGNSQGFSNSALNYQQNAYGQPVYGYGYQRY